MPFAFGFALQVGGGEVGGKIGVGVGTPFSVVDSVQDAAEFVITGAEEAVEAESVLGGLNFTRIGGADSGDGVGEDNSSFKEADHSVKLKAFRMIEHRIEADLLHADGPEIPLVAEVMDGQNALRSEKRRIA